MDQGQPTRTRNAFSTVGLQHYVDEGRLTVDTKDGLNLYCYSRKTQFDGLWDDTIMWCRGLVLDGDIIVARPMKKFFAVKELPISDYEVYPKLDGGMIAVSYYKGRLIVTTKGRFDSHISLLAQPYFSGLEEAFHPDYTYCFEFIHPQTKVIVDYGDEISMTLIAIVHKETGWEIPLVRIKDFPFPVLEPLTELEIKEHMLDQTNKEGFVLRYPDGRRYKLKFDDYINMHRLMTGMSRKRIWLSLSEGKTVAEIAEGAPDETDEWITKTVEELLDQYEDVLMQSVAIKEDIKDLPRREQYQQALKRGNAQVIMRMIDKQDFSKEIWKWIKP